MREMSCGSAASQMCIGTFLARLVMMAVMACQDKEWIDLWNPPRRAAMQALHHNVRQEALHKNTPECPVNSTLPHPQTCVAADTACFSSWRGACPPLLARKACTQVSQSQLR